MNEAERAAASSLQEVLPKSGLVYSERCVSQLALTAFSSMSAFPLTIHRLLTHVVVTACHATGRGGLAEILCKPKILPLKSAVLEQLQRIEREADGKDDDDDDRATTGAAADTYRK